jgi:hypothetical protein
MLTKPALSWPPAVLLLLLLLLMLLLLLLLLEVLPRTPGVATYP